MDNVEANIFRDEVLSSLKRIEDRLSVIESNTAKKPRKKRSDTETDAELEVLIESILAYWNDAFKKSIKNTKGNREPIIARLKEGYEYKEFVQVIYNKWNDPYFKDHPQYFMPATLYGKNMDKYLNGGVVRDDARVKIDTYEDDLKRGMEDEGL